MSRRCAPNARNRRNKRDVLIRRDGAACWYCGTPFAPDVPSTFDHVVPYSQRRTWRVEALVLACEPCNRAKADHPAEVFLFLLTGQ